MEGTKGTARELASRAGLDYATGCTDGPIKVCWTCATCTNCRPLPQDLHLNLTRIRFCICIPHSARSESHQQAGWAFHAATHPVVDRGSSTRLTR